MHRAAFPHLDASSAPVLLANADYYGTLAATRALGQEQVPVYVASERILATAKWSRYATAILTCPPALEANRFLDWLCELGEREPGIVLYPTSDDTTFLYSLRSSELSRTFRMYQPSVDCVLHMLDKRRLYATAREVGFTIPETWFPETESEVDRISREVPMPLMIKPRTQVLSHTRSKGVIVAQRDRLVPMYRKFRRKNGHARALLDLVPDAAQPMVQSYRPEGASAVYTLAGFIERDTERFVARAATKVFQWPRRIGVGLCFEDAPLDRGVMDTVRRLARATGYFGLFEMELIRTASGLELIDFNPRLYNQLAFDIARGLPLPQIVCAAACKRLDEVARRLAEAQTCKNGPLAFCNTFGLGLMLRAQRVSGRMSREDAAAWRNWRLKYAGRVVSPAESRGDTWPQVVDMASQLYACMRNPVAFLRRIAFDRT